MSTVAEIENALQAIPLKEGARQKSSGGQFYGFLCCLI